MGTIITAITDVLTGIMTGFVTAATSLAGLFFTIGESGAVTIEPLGFMILVSLGLVVLRYVVSFVVKLVKSR